ncbi:uncharacterized protein LOC133831870 [Humulus lupulus]|uniref:uncharacterized protein LOC133831870 n=1 Tax=Humulus lupulus TaxID=3486 RepID=UPI002B418217|nr:uncharacterized protein LOC133831870 [Humulus lupulus]
MSAFGTLHSQRAPDETGSEIKIGPSYQHSVPLKEIRVSVTPHDLISLSKIEEVSSGDLRYHYSNDQEVVQHMRHYGPMFKAKVLELVDNRDDGDTTHKVTSEFFPSLHRILLEKKTRGNFSFRGRAQFLSYLMEWTETILRLHRGTLTDTGIYGAIAVSRFPFLIENNIWRAFTELWGPLANTFHHSSGEMGISLYDLKVIGGLPILGIPYEGFIPLNAKLMQGPMRIPIVVELLRTHAQICDHLNSTKVTWKQWVEYFYRGQKVFEGIKGASTSKPSKKTLKRKDAKQIDVRSLPLSASKECILAAFISFWLSRFVFPYQGYDARPETFHMASLMAQGVRVSLAPSVLGCIYHDLNIAATHVQGQGQSFLPIHYVLGWLVEHFRDLYSNWSSSIDLPFLSKYVGVPAENQSLNAARRILREEDYVIHRPYSFPAEEDFDCMDNEDLSEDRFEMLVSMHSSMLPVRVGKELYVEPYFPNRFSRQFGFDQGVPSNELRYSFSRRMQCGIAGVAEAWTLILRRNTGIRFHIPNMTRMGQCTWWYCRWWARTCMPLLGRSVKNLHLELSKQPYEEEDPKYIIKDIREIYSTLDEVFIKCTPNDTEFSNANYVDVGSDSDDTSEVHFKRKKHTKTLEINQDENITFPITQDSINAPLDICIDAPSSRVDELVDFDESDDHVNVEFSDEMLSRENIVPPEQISFMSVLAITNSNLKEYTKEFVVESAIDIDISHIHDIINRGEENLATIDRLSTSVSNKKQVLEDLKIKEAGIIAAELALQQRRTEYETEKASAEKDLSNLEDSLKQHQQIDERIKQSKLEAGVEKFYEVERAKVAKKLTKKNFRRSTIL